MNRGMQRYLEERQAHLTGFAAARPSSGRPGGRPPKVGVAQLYEAEKALLRAPNRHRNMLSAGEPRY